MSSKCSVCGRTFSRHTSYSQHAQLCLKNADELDNDGEVVIEQSNVKTDTRINEECEMDDNENDNNDIQDMSFDSTQSKLISEMSTMSFESILEPDTLESELANTEFSNENGRASCRE